MSHTDMRPLKGIGGFGSAPTNSSSESREVGATDGQALPRTQHRYRCRLTCGGRVLSPPYPRPRPAFSALFWTVVTVAPGTPPHRSFASLGGQ